MRKFVVVLMLFALAIGMTVPALAQERPDLATLLSSDADARFITLSLALEVTGIAEELRGEDYLTVFAPTDAAITTSLEALGLSIDGLQNNPDLMVEILSYHIVPGRYFFRNLAGGAELETLQGDSLNVTLEGGFLTVNGAATVTDIDNIASNGVVHVVDSILIPQTVIDSLSAEATEPEATEVPAEATPAPAGQAAQRPSIVDTLATDADGRFITLSAALMVAGVEFPEGEQFTVFAPSDAAITTSLEALGLSIDDLQNAPDLMSEILSYHIVPGRYFFRNLAGGAELETLQGDSLNVALEGGFLTLNGAATVTDIDNIASNGVVHVVDSVLIPQTVIDTLSAATAEPEATEVPAEATPAPTGQAAQRPSIVDTLATDADGRFITLSAALVFAGVEFPEGEQFTVFAPSEAAIASTLELLGLTIDDLMANPEALSAILNYHVVPGRYFFRDLTRGAELETLQGEQLSVTLIDGVFAVNGTSISDIDNIASNGVIHVIDNVLVPREAVAALATTQVEETPEPEATEVAEAVESASWRFVNLSSDAGDLDVYVNGAAQSVASIGANSASAWGEFAAGEDVSVAFARAGEALENALLTTSFSVNADAATTILLVGSAEAGTLRAVEVSQETAAVDDLASVTFIHAIDGVPSVDVIVNGVTQVVELGYPGTLGDNDGAYTVNLPAGNYNISFDEAGRSWASDSTDFAAGGHYIFALVGTTNSPTVGIQQLD